jgi:deoxyribose-phosphate aldolase
MSRQALARRLIPLIDLTGLAMQEDTATVQNLARRALTPAGPVACLCTWPALASDAMAALAGTRIPVCVVVNFPAGTASAEATVGEITRALAQGAAEIDIVLPYTAVLDGDDAHPLALLRAARAACGSRALLKVILETGKFGQDHARLRQAADLALDAGADFLKTSTGKTAPGATPEAAAVLLDALVAAAARGRHAGFKASGGIRTMEDARCYLALFEQRFGADSADPACFRIGASALLDELLSALS